MRFVSAPKGLGRPWYPLFVSTVEAEPTADGYTLRVAGPVVRKRVGLRRWAKNLGRHEPEA